MERKLFVLQRLSAVLLGPLVLVHLGMILFAVKNGLTGEEILARTNGSVSWATFYLLFVLAVAVHGPIGLRNILGEWTPLPARAVNVIAVLFAALVLFAGIRAVVAVY